MTVSAHATLCRVLPYKPQILDPENPKSRDLPAHVALFHVDAPELAILVLGPLPPGPLVGGRSSERGVYRQPPHPITCRQTPIPKP